MGSRGWFPAEGWRRLPLPLGEGRGEGVPRRVIQGDQTPAGELILEEIRRDGPLTFRRFMELALYAPEVGYYAQASAGPGPEAAYVTSPELHPAFGGLLCGQLVEMWDALDRPSPFWLVEGGPGS